MELRYFNIQRFCLHDGPGIRTTVFCKGCPLRCRWCHNPESLHAEPELFFQREKCTRCGACLDVCRARSRCPDGAIRIDRAVCTGCGKCVGRCPNGANSIRGQSGTVEEILQDVEKDRPFYETSGGGLTVSGGEPSVQADAVLALLRSAKAQRTDIAIETCGCGARAFYAEAAQLGCLFLFDLKGIDPQKHKANTGVGVETIHGNLDFLLQTGARVIPRLPLIPGYNDSDDDLRLLCRFLAARRDRFPFAQIMPYHALGTSKRRALGLSEDDDISDGQAFVDRWLSLLSPAGTEIQVSGR